jgi:hypothetical protein
MKPAAKPAPLFSKPRIGKLTPSANPPKTRDGSSIHVRNAADRALSSLSRNAKRS